MSFGIGNRFGAFLLLGAVALGAVACAPTDLESTPIKVATPKGEVVCQLYTRDLVYWDRAISEPAGMSPDEADAICRGRGDEWKKTGR